VARSVSIDDLLKTCDPEQREIIETDHKPLLVMAGAGSGKTRVLTYRIYHQIAREKAKPGHILAITFTRKAAASMQERLLSFGLPHNITAGTFHAVALSCLKRYSADNGKRPPNILANKSLLLAEILKNNPSISIRSVNKSLSDHTRYKNSGPKIQQFASDLQYLTAVSNELDWISSKALDADSYIKALVMERRKPFVPEGVALEIFNLYRQEKKKRSLLDFDDLIINLTELIRHNYHFASILRWQYQHIFVDEIQDINWAQLDLLKAILNTSNDVFAVGDTKQSIYGWNGAVSDIENQFKSAFPGTHVLYLSANYRSTPQIVEVASSVLEHSQQVSFIRDNGSVPKISIYADELNEADQIAKKIRSLRFKADGYHNIAILARTNSQCELIKQSLVSYNIPTQTNILPSISLMQNIARNFNDSPGSFQMMLRDMEMFLEDMDLQETENLSVEKESSGPGSKQATTESQAKTFYDKDLLVPSFSSRFPQEQKEIVRSLQIFYDLANEYRAFEASPDISGFLYWLSLTQKGDVLTEKNNLVQVLTFHRAKGLEWKIVFITGLEEGFVPIYSAIGEEEMAEEKRLLYVALSRATDELYLSWAKTRKAKTKILPRSKSRWLQDIEEAIKTQSMKEHVPEYKIKELIKASKMLL